MDFAVAAELFMTPTAELCDYVLPATSFLETSNLSNDFKHRQQSRLHVQYRSAVVEPLAERRSDTWVVFQLAKRLGLGEKFWQGDIAEAYECELASTGISLAQLKASPGGITVSMPPRHQNSPRRIKTANRAASTHRIRKWRFIRTRSPRTVLPRCRNTSSR